MVPPLVSFSFRFKLQGQTAPHRATPLSPHPSLLSLPDCSAGPTSFRWQRSVGIQISITAGSGIQNYGGGECAKCRVSYNPRARTALRFLKCPNSSLDFCLSFYPSYRTIDVRDGDYRDHHGALSCFAQPFFHATVRNSNWVDSVAKA